MRVYITKYALTKGIEEVEATISMFTGVVVVESAYRNLFHKGEWFESKDDAIKKAEEMRLKKIQTLKRQIAKLNTMKFK